VRDITKERRIEQTTRNSTRNPMVTVKSALDDTNSRLENSRLEIVLDIVGDFDKFIGN
jgi:hypothetical protein